MLKKIKLENVLFLDIETVPLFANFSELDDSAKQLWEQVVAEFPDSSSAKLAEKRLKGL